MYVDQGLNWELEDSSGSHGSTLCKLGSSSQQSLQGMVLHVAVEGLKKINKRTTAVVNFFTVKK